MPGAIETYARPSTAGGDKRLRIFYARLETLVVGVILAFPLFGTFMPIETYLHPNTSVLVNAQQPTETFGFSHMVTVFVEAFAIYLLAMYRRGMLRSARRGALLCAFLLLIFASCAWAPDPGVSFKRAVHFFTYTVFAVFLFQRYEIDDFMRYMTRVLAVPVFASFAILAVSPNLGFSSYLGDPYAIRGAALDKNALGDIMSFAVLTSGYALMIGAGSRLLSGTVLLGSLTLVALTPSTTARIVVAITIALAAYAWIIRKRSNPGWGIIGLMLTVIAATLVALVILDYEDLLKLVGKSATLTGRTGVWRVVIESIRQRPLLGFGYAFWGEPSVSRSNIWLELGWATPHAHNNWLDIALQLGIVGLAIAASFWLISMGRAIFLGLFTGETGAVFMALILANLFIRSWTESVMLEPAEMFWMWFVIAYLYLSRMSDNRLRRA
jgi:exopolysaccharide production protein ExoQ